MLYLLLSLYLLYIVYVVYVIICYIPSNNAFKISDFFLTVCTHAYVQWWEKKWFAFKDTPKTPKLSLEPDFGGAGCFFKIAAA
jgi:hypothetical protein